MSKWYWKRIKPQIEETIFPHFQYDNEVVYAGDEIVGPFDVYWYMGGDSLYAPYTKTLGEHEYSTYDGVWDGSFGRDAGWCDYSHLPWVTFSSWYRIYFRIQTEVRFYDLYGVYKKKAFHYNLNDSYSARYYIPVSTSYVVCKLVWDLGGTPRAYRVQYHSIPIINPTSSYPSINYEKVRWYTYETEVSPFTRPHSFKNYHGNNYFTDGGKLYLVTGYSNTLTSNIQLIGDDPFLPEHSKKIINYYSTDTEHPETWAYFYNADASIINEHDEKSYVGYIANYDQSIILPGEVYVTAGEYEYLGPFIDDDTLYIYDYGNKYNIGICNYDEEDFPIFCSNHGEFWKMKNNEYSCIISKYDYNVKKCNYIQDKIEKDDSYPNYQGIGLAHCWHILEEDGWNTYMVASVGSEYYKYKLVTDGFCSCGPITKTAYKTFNRYG